MNTGANQGDVFPSKGVKGIPWLTIIAGIIFVGLGTLVLFLTSAPVVTAWLRWAVTILWIVYTLVLGYNDFVRNQGVLISRGRAAGERDTVPFDLWTISHTGAGIVFGIWFMPLLYVLILTILWEFYERYFAGIGDKENLINRAVDVGVAVAGWLVVVLIVMAATGASFPLISPYKP